MRVSQSNGSRLHGRPCLFAQRRGQINEKDVEAFCERGILRGARGDLDRWISNFTKAIKLNPQAAKAYANRGMIMLLRGQDTAAQMEFDTALRLDNTLNPGLQNRINQIVRDRKSKP